MSQAQELKQLVGAEAERRAFLEEMGLLLPPAHRERLERIFELELAFGPIGAETKPGQSGH